VPRREPAERGEADERELEERARLAVVEDAGHDASLAELQARGPPGRRQLT